MTDRWVLRNVYLGMVRKRVLLAVVVMIVVSVVMMMTMVTVRLPSPLPGPPPQGGREDALHMMVMTCLRQADLRLETQHLPAVFAELAVHEVAASKNLVHALDKSLDHQGMVVEVRRLDEVDAGMAGGDRIGGVVEESGSPHNRHQLFLLIV